MGGRGKGVEGRKPPEITAKHICAILYGRPPLPPHRNVAPSTPHNGGRVGGLRQPPPPQQEARAARWERRFPMISYDFN